MHLHTLPPTLPCSYRWTQEWTSYFSSQNQGSGWQKITQTLSGAAGWRQAGARESRSHVGLFSKQKPRLLSHQAVERQLFTWSLGAHCFIVRNSRGLEGAPDSGPLYLLHYRWRATSPPNSDWANNFNSVALAWVPHLVYYTTNPTECRVSIQWPPSDVVCPASDVECPSRDLDSTVTRRTLDGHSTLGGIGGVDIWESPKLNQKILTFRKILSLRLTR